MFSFDVSSVHEYRIHFPSHPRFDPLAMSIAGLFCNSGYKFLGMMMLLRQTLLQRRLVTTVTPSFGLHPRRSTAAPLSQPQLHALIRITSGQQCMFRRSLYSFIQSLRGGAVPISDEQVGSSPESLVTLNRAANCDVSGVASVCSVQGRRSYMEDELILAPNNHFFAVFDGHGGPKVSRYLRQNLYAELQTALQQQQDQAPTAVQTTTHSQAYNVKDYETALVHALDKVDQDVQRISHWSFQGSTALAVWMHIEPPSANTETDDSTVNEDSAVVSPSSSSESTATTPSIKSPRRTLVTANIGDSRAVLSRNGTAIPLSRDHKPNDPIERSRIEATGGHIVFHGHIDDVTGVAIQGVYRVNGNLALSRAVGDRSERPAVNAEPELSSIELDPELDEFFVLATDGLWDVMRSDEVVTYVRSALMAESPEREEIASMMVKEALRRGSYDNISVIIVWLDPKCNSVDNLRGV